MTVTGRSVIVVVPTLGERHDTLAESLASVQSQYGVDVRLVVVAPRTAELARATARDHGATVVDDPKRGLSAAVNAGIAARQGESYFAWLGDDDLLEPGGLEHLCGLLEHDEDAVVAFGACRYIDEDGRQVAMSRAGDVASRILLWGPDLVPQPASLTRVDALIRAGEYDEALRFAMDLDMFLRLKRLGRFVSTQRPVASFRWHPVSLTVANRSLSLAESEKVKRRYLPSGVRPFSPLWEIPVRWATRLAARQVNARARRVAGSVRARQHR